VEYRPVDDACFGHVAEQGEVERRGAVRGLGPSWRSQERRGAGQRNGAPEEWDSLRA